jgi:hypothetical protein
MPVQLAAQDKSAPRPNEVFAFMMKAGATTGSMYPTRTLGNSHGCSHGWRNTPLHSLTSLNLAGAIITDQCGPTTKASAISDRLTAAITVLLTGYITALTVRSAFWQSPQRSAKPTSVPAPARGKLPFCAGLRLSRARSCRQYSCYDRTR